MLGVWLLEFSECLKAIFCSPLDKLFTNSFSLNSRKTFFVKKLLEEVERNVASISLSDNATDSDLEYSVSYHETFKWTIALFLCELFRAISFSIMFAITIRTCIRTVNALNGAIYDKIMSKLNSNTDRSQSIQPSNLFANDLWKVYQMIYMAPLMIGSPIIILVTIFYTIYLIGSSAILGLILFVLMFVLQFFLTKQQTFLRTRIMQQTDNRISLITQLMKFIRTIKFNAWDEVFQKDIECVFVTILYQFHICLIYLFLRLPSSGIDYNSAVSIHTMFKHFDGFVDPYVDHNNQYFVPYTSWK